MVCTILVHQRTVLLLTDDTTAAHGRLALDQVTLVRLYLDLVINQSIDEHGSLVQAVAIGLYRVSSRTAPFGLPCRSTLVSNEGGRKPALFLPLC